MVSTEGLVAKTNEQEFVAKSLTYIRLPKLFFFFLKVPFVMLPYL